MNKPLRAFLADLFDDGVAHDAAQPARLLKRRNLEPATAELVDLLVRITGAQRVVVVGTANDQLPALGREGTKQRGGRLERQDVAGALPCGKRQ